MANTTAAQLTDRDVRKTISGGPFTIPVTLLEVDVEPDGLPRDPQFSVGIRVLNDGQDELRWLTAAQQLVVE